MDCHIEVASENLDSCLRPQNSKWVSEVLIEMDQNIQRMLKLIEESDNQSISISNVTEFNNIYQSLTERYDRLTQELMNSVPRDAQLSGSDHTASSPLTPKGHLDLLKSGRLPVSFSSGSSSSDIPLKVDSDSSSEFESESEAFYSSLNHHLVSPGTNDSQIVKEGGEENTWMIKKQMNYRQLMKKIVEYEEELRTSTLKLQDSEHEIEKLKGEIEKIENLRAELETSKREIELRDAVIETEKRRVFELQGQVLLLETKLSDSSFKIENLASEVDVSRECLDVSDAEISKLKEMLSDYQKDFIAEKERMEADFYCLLEKHVFLGARVQELESKGELLEDQIRNSNAENMKVRALLHSNEAEWQADMNKLKVSIASRDECIESLNKDFDEHKQRYDMLMADKDEVSAKLDNLRAELRSKDIQIKQMEDYMNQMHHKHNELVSETGIAKNVAEELRVRVKELEKEVVWQRHAISEGEEEKREAIRQLCFTLDHYRSGYRQLVRSLSGNNKRQAAVIVV